MHKDIIFYLQFYKKHSYSLVFTLLLTFAQAATLFPLALIFQFLFDEVLPGGDRKMLFASLGFALLLVLFNSLIILVNRSIALRVIKTIICNIREKLLHQVLFLNHTFYTDEDLDALHTKVVQDTERLDCMTAAILTQFLPGVLIVSGLTAFLLYLNMQLFFVLILTLPPLLYMGRMMGRQLKKRVELFHDDFAKFSKGISFILHFNALIKQSTNEKNEFGKQKEVNEKLMISGRKVAWLAAAYTTIQGNIFVVGGILIFLFGGLQVMDGTTSTGELLSFFVALNIMSSYLRTVLGVVPVIIEGRTSLAAIAPILHKAAPESTGEKAPLFANSILFDNADFGFPDGFELKNICFEIKKNSITGIFGPSGSGKSTLIKLLLGVYKVKHGAIFLDDVNLNEINLPEYRKKVGVLAQDPQFFSGTIRENLTYGLNRVSDDTLALVCKKCRIHDFIVALPQGYDSIMGNSGMRLSGGQKQRIAIARALLRNPELLILDEPDNNLDEAMTLEILKSIKELNITLIVISHNHFVLPVLDTVYRLT
ncbi:MAG: ABC transporter ATP-binding protein [Flavobacteriales bacterium]